MNLSTFLIHFFYIFGTFIAGFGVGFIYKEKLAAKLNELFKKDKV